MAQLLTAGALLAGLTMGAYQVGRVHRRHRDALGLEVVRIARDEGTARALQQVLHLPDGVTEADLAVRGPEAQAAVTLVEHTMDTLGWMVHRRLIPLHDLDDLMGGLIRAVWRRVHILAEERRHVRGRATDFEWTQWLAERLEADPSRAKLVGAHNHYRAWRP